MKNLITFLCFISLLFYGCKTSNNISNENKMKKNQFTGTIIYQEEKIIGRSFQPEKELYFRMNDKDYFIKISEGYVSKETLHQYENKLVRIKGELKNGIYKQSQSGSFNNQKTPTKPRSGNYITIYKIFK